MWYTETDPKEPVSQGDIFLNCPIFSIDPESVDLSNPSGITQVKTILYTANVVVVTQACDLNPDDKNIVDNVVVVPLDDVATMETEGNKKNFVSDVRVGRRPNCYLLNKHSGEIKMGYQIADFSTVTTVPYDHLMSLREFHGLRLRLNSPHRELLSQKFGNYFARIGLPEDDSIDKKDLEAVVGNS